MASDFETAVRFGGGLQASGKKKFEKSGEKVKGKPRKWFEQHFAGPYYPLWLKSSLKTGKNAVNL